MAMSFCSRPWKSIRCYESTSRDETGQAGVDHMITDLERHELLIHPVGVNAEVILWLWEGVWEGKDEKGVRYIGLVLSVLKLGRECMHSFILQIFIQLLLCQALGIQSELNIISALMEFTVQNFSIWINLLTILVLFSLNEWNQSNQ